jgi:hypothetical protein
MRPTHSTRRARGFALFAVLGVVLLLTVIVAFTITISGQERSQAGKGVHNATLQSLTESTLQYGKGYFLSKYPNLGWNTYLAYFVNNPPVVNTATDFAATVTGIQNNLDVNLVPVVPAGYSCFLYARDDIDELTSAQNDMTTDKNQFIYIGAVCSISTSGSGTNAPLLAELSAPLMYVSPTKVVNRAH